MLTRDLIHGACDAGEDAARALSVGDRFYSAEEEARDAGYVIGELPATLFLAVFHAVLKVRSPYTVNPVTNRIVTIGEVK